MRTSLISILLLIFPVLIFSQRTEDIKITYEENDISLKEVFADLEAQYGIRFSYATSTVDEIIMDVSFRKKSIDDVLKYLLQDQPMEFKIVSNNVLIRKRENYKETPSERYQSTLHIKGKIYNSHNSNEGLDYATISVSNSSIGSYADASGQFDIEIPESLVDENLVIQYLGYADETYKISELENSYLLVPMDDSDYSFEEVMIVNRKKPLKIGTVENSIQLNSGQISSQTSSIMGQDLAKQIQLLPGISAHDDDSAEIKIRGSNADETLIILDGMPIYNASHYYGIFSNINTSYIDSVNIFKNTYPIHYGGKTAGLVELFSDHEQPSKLSGNFDINLLTASGSLSVPISGKSHLSLAARSTLGKVNNDKFNTVKSQTRLVSELESFSQLNENAVINPSFTFNDINAHYFYQIDKKSSLAINFFKSRDIASNSYRNSRKNKRNQELNLQASEYGSWSNVASSIVAKINLGKNLSLNSTGYITNHKNSDTNQFSLNKENPQGGQIFPGIPDSTSLDSYHRNRITDIGIDNHLVYTRQNQQFKIGLAGIHHDVDYLFFENMKSKLRGDESFFEFTGYVGHTLNLFDKLAITSGIRATYFSNVEEMAWAPRFLLNYVVTDHFSLKSSFNIENQMIRQFYYEYRGEPMEIWVSAGTNEIPILRSQNFMLGTTIKMSHFSLDIELYRKDMNGVLEYLIPNAAEGSNSQNQSRDYDLFVGNGISRGIDVILSSGYQNYDTYLSYTLSRSEEQYKEIFLSRFFASENDRTHQLKWVNTLTSGKWTWGMNAIYVSGRPYTDIRNFDPTENIINIDPDRRLRRVPAYHRFDVSAGYSFKLKKMDARITASIFNLLNIQNVKYIQSISTDIRENQTTVNTILGNEIELLNRTFNLGLNVAF